MAYRESAPAGEIDALPRVLTLRDATMLVVSSVIGVGIFFTPGGVAKLLPSPGWFFAAWLAASRRLATSTGSVGGSCPLPWVFLW